MLSPFRIGLAHLLDLLKQDDRCVNLGEGGEHDQRADARKQEHDPGLRGAVARLRRLQEN